MLIAERCLAFNDRLANGRQQSATSLIMLDNYLPLGSKKAAKVYTIACHPLLPHLVAIGANAGMLMSLFFLLQLTVFESQHRAVIMIAAYLQAGTDGRARQSSCLLLTRAFKANSYA